jgi:hypothetical protein
VGLLADQAKVGFGFLSLNTLSKLEQAKEPAREEQVSCDILPHQIKDYGGGFPKSP